MDCIYIQFALSRQHGARKSLMQGIRRSVAPLVLAAGRARIPQTHACPDRRNVPICAPNATRGQFAPAVTSQIMSGKSLLHSPRPAARAPSTPGQDRFRFLVDRIEKVRHARADWDKLVVAFKASESERVHPLRESLKQVTRETVLLIDRL